MQRVIELARTIRERHGRTVKTPVRELVVVHSDQAFLDDLTGALRPAVHDVPRPTRAPARAPPPHPPTHPPTLP
jgi:hypothetical protein